MTGDSGNPAVPRPPEPADNPNIRTFPEMLDAAASGEEFGQLLMGMFATLDRQRHQETDDD